MPRIKRPSAPLVISIMALIAAIVVPAYALNKQVIVHTAKSKRGPQGPPGPQGIPGQNGSPDTGSQILGKLAPVDGSGSGLDADSLDGHDSADFAGAGSDGWTELRLNDGSRQGLDLAETTCYWRKYGGPYTTPAYFRDSAGIVHLKGIVVAHDGTLAAGGTAACNGDYQTPFNIRINSYSGLNLGYWPGETSVFPVLSGNALGRIDITQDGSVQIDPNFPGSWANAKTFVSLDGISYRCAPSGQDGCP